MPLDIDKIINYNMFMRSDNILTEFTAFIQKSAAMMLNQQPPAAATISAPPPPTTAAEGTQSQSLVAPAVTSQSLPRTAAMPMSNNAAPVAAPKPATNTSKPMKATKF
jgi:hypothetical protein